MKSGTGSETEMDHSEMEDEVEAEPQAAPSKKGKKRVGRKSAGVGKKVAKTPTKGKTRSSARKVKTATPNARTAPAPKKSKSKIQGRPKSGGKQKEEKDFEVEKIVGVKWETNRKEFLVKWKGYGAPTWEPEANVDRCQDLIQNFINSIKN